MKKQIKITVSMNSFKKLFLALGLVACGGTAFAQTESEELGYEPYPYNFVQLQGGISTVLRDNMYLTPTASVGFGRFFGSAIGARLHVNGWQSKGGFDAFVLNNEGNLVNKDLTYKYRYLTTDLDLLFNINNLFKGNDRHLFNVILVGGVGLGYAWHNGELNGLLNNDAYLLSSGNPLKSSDMFANAWGVDGAKNDHHLWTHNLRVGLLLDFNVSKHLSVGVEADLNSLDDDFNARYSNNDDWMLTAQLSLTYKFGFKARKAPVAVPVQVVQTVDNSRNTEQVVTTPTVEEKPVEVEKAKREIEVHFALNSSSLSSEESANVEKLANWLKLYPKTKVSITGYADKGTGTAAINRKLSEQRVKAVSDELVQKYGIDASRIQTNYKGDTEQPFADNDSNRVVVGQAVEE